MIIEREPQDWHELQNLVAKIFDELGCIAEINKTIETVRGRVAVDVLVQDPSHTPPLLFLCECKYWSSSVPKTVVHAFRTVVSDFGANRGFLISKLGFQSGAIEAAHNSSVELMTWAEFQNIFFDRWVKVMTERLYEPAEAIFEYMDFLAARMNAIKWTEDKRLQYENLVFRSCIYMYATRWLQFGSTEMKQFPMEIPDPNCPRGAQSMVQLNNYREYFDLAYAATPGLLAEWRGFFGDSQTL
jgi:hypothetical protein